MPTTASLPPLPNADALVRHNIEVWRGMGYPDHFIAQSMMEPPLLTRAEYMQWGLAWPKRKKPKPEVRTRKRQTALTPERALEAIERAIATPGVYRPTQICAELKTCARTLNEMREDYPDVDAAYRRLVRKNRKNRDMSAINQVICFDMARAEALLAQAIANEQPINGAAICHAIGRSRSWIAVKVKKGDARAKALTAAIKKHNQSLRRK